jgi:type VI secretion system protein ImpH
MAEPSRQPPDALSALRELETHFASFEFFAALRRIECAYPDSPRLGRGARSAEDPVRLGQVPALAFAPATFAAAGRRADGRLWLGGAFFGLFGPNGPLPLHLTEYAHDRSHNFRDPTLARFADIFHHRLHCLLYRGWADAQPAVHYDRPATDRFRSYLGALIGIGQTTLRDRDAMPDAAKLHHCGRIAGCKNPEGLRALLEDFFHESAAVREFQGEWLSLHVADRWRLGAAGASAAPGGGATLGAGCTLGARVWGAQSRFQIALGPLSFGSFGRFLPGGAALGQLHAIVRNYVGFEFEWDVRLILARDQVPGVRLGGGGRLGWNTWLGSPRRTRDADDAVLAGSLGSATRSH